MLNKRGSSLVEAVVAIGLASLFMWATVGLAIAGKQGAEKAANRQEALWYAHEGLNALRSMSYDDLVLTETGNVTFASNQWSLATDGSQTVGEDYTRTVKVQEVLRDDQCGVATEGAPDPDTRHIISEVVWTDVRGKEQTITLDSLVTNWSNPQGGCSEMADAIAFDFSFAEWYGDKQLRDIYFTNTSTEEIVIDKMTMIWDNDVAIYELFMDTSKVWSANGTGSPSGDQYSGAELDIVDSGILGNDTVELPKLQFRLPMNGASLQFIIEFIDGSIATSPEFTPAQ